MDLPYAAEWFTAEDAGEGIVRLYEPCVHPLIQSNVYVACGANRNLVIDTGTGVGALRPFLPMMTAEPDVVATHVHYDHTGGLAEFSSRLIHGSEADELGRPDQMAVLVARLLPPGVRRFLGLSAHDCLLTAVPERGYDPSTYQRTMCTPTRSLHDGDVLDLGDRRLEVLHLPGHSPGSICLFDPDTKVMFTGDVVYDGGLIDEGLPGTDRDSYIRSMQRLADIDIGRAYPGHGDPLTRLQTRRIVERYLSHRADPKRHERRI